MIRFDRREMTNLVNLSDAVGRADAPMFTVAGTTVTSGRLRRWLGSVWESPEEGDDRSYVLSAVLQADDGTVMVELHEQADCDWLSGGRPRFRLAAARYEW